MPDAEPPLSFGVWIPYEATWTWMPNLDYGNVQEFITWIVAGIALLWARQAAKAAAKANEYQDKQIRALLAEKRESQASKIVAWCDRDPANPDGTILCVLNASDAPVYSIKVFVVDDDPEVGAYCTEYFVRWTLPPRLDPIIVTVDHYLTGADLETTPDYLDVYLEFADTAGHGWVRDCDGRLHLKASRFAGWDFLARPAFQFGQLEEKRLQDRGR